MANDDLNLASALKVIDGTLAYAREADFKTLGVVVVDPAGHLIAFSREDGASFFRFDVALGKAAGCVAMQAGGRWLHGLAEARPTFTAALANAAGGKLVPARGGVLIRDAGGTIIGAVGVSGDSSERDEECAMAGIEAAGLAADPG